MSDQDKFDQEELMSADEVESHDDFEDSEDSESLDDLEFQADGLPWADDEADEAEVDTDSIVGESESLDEAALSMEGTELEGFESAEIEEEEEIPEDRVVSIVESLLFATDRPQSIAVIKQAFKGTKVRSHHIRRALEQLQVEYAGGRRGISLEEVAGGYQLRTKLDNMDYLKRTVKAKPFRLSGPALEVLAIVAYKQPLIKSQIDEIRGVESGHLLRALMEKSLVHFEGKSELPGKPMLYGTTKRFLETFGLRNLKELPSLSEIDELIPEGIGAEEDKETLSEVGDRMAQEAVTNYSSGEEELERINLELEKVTTTTEFFEQEKQRMKEQRERERAQDLLEALALGEEITTADERWLNRYQASQLAPQGAEKEAVDSVETQEASNAEAIEAGVVDATESVSEDRPIEVV